MSESDSERSAANRSTVILYLDPQSTKLIRYSLALPSQAPEVTGRHQIPDPTRPPANSPKATPQDLDSVASDAPHHVPNAPHPWRLHQLPTTILIDGSSWPTSGALQTGVLANFVTKQCIENTIRQGYVSRAPRPVTCVQVEVKTSSASDDQPEWIKQWCEWHANRKATRKNAAGSPALLKKYLARTIQQVLASNAGNKDTRKHAVNPQFGGANRACVRKRRRR